MFISASRRTDIPAFYADWMVGRLRAGYCTVPNPFNRNQVAPVSLRPEDVEAIVFWPRNPPAPATPPGGTGRPPHPLLLPVHHPRHHEGGVRLHCQPGHWDVRLVPVRLPLLLRHAEFRAGSSQL